MEKVLLGMSGGVDSTAAAIFLQEAGYEVIGVTYRLVESEDETYIEDAKNAANKLGIEHFVADLTKEFRKSVIENFLDEYAHARTPNPCVVCNKNIKFGAIFDVADNMGIKYVSTGQYSRVEKVGDEYFVKKAINEEKDQTYFIYNLKEEYLPRILFPLGNVESKDHIREMLKERGIEIFSKKDSQEICFIKNKKYSEYIEQETGIKYEKGEFVDTDGNVLGEHAGIINYTIGQRRGLGIALGKPAFVTDLQAEKNRVVLGEDEDLFSKCVKVKNLNIINASYVRDNMIVDAKIRYAGSTTSAIAYMKDENTCEVIFDKPVRAVTKGQSLVMYDGDILIGGGIIE